MYALSLEEAVRAVRQYHQVVVIIVIYCSLCYILFYDASPIHFFCLCVSVSQLSVWCVVIQTLIS